jgi:hypothetical protein
VFHEDDPFVHQLRGMANTYKVSSCCKSTQMVLVHGRTFCSFPSLANMSLVSCFPSTLFLQLLHMKNRLHVAMNTRRMDAKNCVTIHCDTIDPSTWVYTKKHLPASDVRHTICKATYIEEDDGVVEKRRGLQESIT